MSSSTESNVQTKLIQFPVSGISFKKKNVQYILNLKNIHSPFQVELLPEPTNKYDKIFEYSKKNFVGESFLINPEDLLFYSYKYSYREIAQYLALASLRSYADYLATGNSTLDLRKVEVDTELFSDNRLLGIEGNNLHFLYEEVPPKEKLH